MVARRMLPGLLRAPQAPPSALARAQPGKAALCRASWRAGGAAAGESHTGVKPGSEGHLHPVPRCVLSLRSALRPGPPSGAEELCASLLWWGRLVHATGLGSLLWLMCWFKRTSELGPPCAPPAPGPRGLSCDGWDEQTLTQHR